VSAVYNPEADTIARIEALELEARDIRRKIEHIVSQADQKVLNRQLKEIQDEIEFLRSGLD
jgi:hypothetical protein